MDCEKEEIELELGEIYKKYPSLNKEQRLQISLGAYSELPSIYRPGSCPKVNFKLYAHPKFSARQMYHIRQGLKEGQDMFYCDPCVSAERMGEIVSRQRYRQYEDY